MAAKNDITGDSIISRTNSKDYEDKFDTIFGEDRKKRLEEKKKSDTSGKKLVQRRLVENHLAERHLDDA